MYCTYVPIKYVMGQRLKSTYRSWTRYGYVRTTNIFYIGSNIISTDLRVTIVQ